MRPSFVDEAIWSIMEILLCKQTIIMVCTQTSGNHKNTSILTREIIKSGTFKNRNSSNKGDKLWWIYRGYLFVFV